MRGTLASLIVVILILIAAAFKMFFGSSRFAGSETISTSRSDGISVYELHLNHPDKESLPTQETPSPWNARSIGSADIRADAGNTADSVVAETCVSLIPDITWTVESVGNPANEMALAGVERDRTPIWRRYEGIGAELRTLHSDMLREEVSDRMAELVKQLDQPMES